LLLFYSIFDQINGALVSNERKRQIKKSNFSTVVYMETPVKKG